MAISEESRHHLYQRLEAVLGPEEATTLMEHLPPVGWGDVATKRDLDAGLVLMRTEMESEFRAVRTEMRADLRAVRQELVGEMHAQTTRLVLWMVPMLLTALGIAVGVSRIG